MKVHHIRLQNGDEILTEIINETDSIIFVKNPYVVEEIPNEGGSSTIILSKYLLSSDEENTLSLKHRHIVTITEVHEEIQRYYLNSIIHNKLIEQQKIQDIHEVNNLLEQMNEDRNKRVVLKNVEKNRVHIGSNTVH